MEPWFVKLLAPISFVLLFLAGPACGAIFLTWRRRRVRAERKSPIGRDMLTSPGHRLREQMDDLNGRITEDLIVLMVLPMGMAGVFMAQVLTEGPEHMWRVSWLYGLTIFVGITVATRRLLRKSAEMDNLRAGYDAELAVGQELDQLMCQGARVFHDLPGEQFNIDHVVISPRGVFAVETKGYTKQIGSDGRAGKTNATVIFDGSALRFPGWTTPEPLQQAERQAKWLSKWLSSATGDTHTALPVLALPGWFVDRQGRGGVRVYSGRELPTLLQALGTKSLTPDQLERAVHQVDQRCRTVAPSFNRNMEAKK